MSTTEKCRRCYRSLVECSTCKGRGSIWGMSGGCTECSGTGYRCPDHGEHWN